MSDKHSTESWVAPNNANPKVILRQAKSDARNGRFGAALDKYLWLYSSDVSIEARDLSKALNSSCLLGWARLAQFYPPARIEILTYRDRIRDCIRYSTKENSHLRDLITINHVFNQDVDTAELFLLIERHDNERAKSLFVEFQDALVQTGKLNTCLRYFDFDQSLDVALSRYKQQTGHAGILASDSIVVKEGIRFAKKHFAYKLSIIIVLLTSQHQNDKAEKLISRASKDFNLGSDNCKELRKAMRGELPAHYLSRITAL